VLEVTGLCTDIVVREKVLTDRFSLALLDRSLQSSDGGVERDFICERNERGILHKDLSHWRLENLSGRLDGRSEEEIGACMMSHLACFTYTMSTYLGLNIERWTLDMIRTLFQIS
jgi:hypothetical protein